jgi:digeranylgeranylglycerophospholipid reductase
MTVMGPDEKQYQVSARIFVAADGVESKVARLAGMNNMIDTYDVEALLQYRLEDVDVDADKMEFYFGNRIAPRGYVWVFPKSDRSANVGLGVSSALEPGVRSKAYLDEFIRKRFKKYRITGTFCGLVPRFQGGDKFKMKNLLIAGDAARSDDSLSGAGIVNALLSGIFAGKAAAAFIRGDVTGGRDLAELYPGAFLKIKENELKMYSRFREIYNRLDDDDFDDIIKYLEGHLGGRPIESLSPLKILSGVIMKRARLLRMAKYLF